MITEDELRIDDSALDVEWLEQPSLMRRAVKEASQARKELDSVKANLELVQAQVDKQIRENPEEYGLVKTTETVIHNTILMQEKYQSAYQKVVDASYRLNLAQGIVRTVEQKKDALENLVRLYGQSYFAGPSIPRNLTEERQKREQKANATIKITRRK